MPVEIQRLLIKDFSPIFSFFLGKYVTDSAKFKMAKYLIDRIRCSLHINFSNNIISFDFYNPLRSLS